MSKVYRITDRIADRERKRQIQNHRQKIETIQRAVQCSSCHFKCAMCGLHLEGEGTSCPHALSFQDFNLCENCREEFEDFLKTRKGEKPPEVFWHNQEWLNLWSAWLNYQEAIKEFKKSQEFQQLITETED